MTTRWFGAKVQRVEDDRLLRGNGHFTDDIDDGALESVLVRSPFAHARINSIDVSAARALPGVSAVYLAADLPFGQTDLPILIPHPNLTHGRTQRCLASDVVRYVGEAVAFVVAENRYIAEDAADLVEVDYEPLPVVITPEASAAAEHLVHDDVPGNVAAEMIQDVGDVQSALAAAPHRKRLHLRFERGAASPMEARAVWARWSEPEHRLTVYDSTQSPTSIRGGLAVLFRLPESDVDVIAPDVGGGFGPKIMLFYPDELLVPFAAMRLGRPVKWTEDRQEHFTAVNQERGQVHEVEVGFDGDGRVLALDDDFIHDAGAYTPYGIILPIITAAQVPGPYRVPNYRVRFRDVYTNATPTSPYRGAGRPHACFAMERTLDAIAAELALDRIEVRRRNLIQSDQFPYEVGVAWQDGNRVIYDSGNYPALVERALQMLGPRPDGDHIGMGLSPYVEGTGVGPYEGAHVQVLVSGKVIAATGIPSQGQAHATAWAQIVADQLGVDVGDVEVTSGDTRKFQWGVGTFASRGAVTAGNAMAVAAGMVAEKAKHVAADFLEVDPADLELVGGAVRVKGSPDRGIPLAAVAVLANPMRYAFGGGTEAATQFTARPRPGPPLLEGQEPGLEATGYFSPVGSAWAAGCHAAYVRVDPKTFRLEILKYVVVHDCGRLINPLVVEGQIEGGVAQGIGGAFYERLAYDADGQLRNASFMEFLMPYATEIPEIEIDHIETPSPLNPLGIKGAGEAGVIPVGAVIASAVEEALGIPITEMPLSPLKLYELSQAQTS
ncbi:MAG: xanthine dehydrogenase [Actinobacteria bacterium 13_1_20CM_2_65_11]|nr:MAG: xanthine dehydrogenase [Chloroflexi bacterium 13_1_40CM_3_65_12]OLD48431.1 MAG: xanthine dehydrogenase [Actinobacteria bacterium 13_1_40CM_2_65_8]OLE81836.1 MAG: xanthine dehydrogenase [Actinobacteria bacterium 13_1_20CM_2_65_11]